MYRNLFILFLCVLGALQLKSQGTGLSDQAMFALGNLDPNSAIFVVSREGMKIEGTQFKNDDWTDARIRLKKINTFSEIVEVLLDLENQELYFRFKNDKENLGKLLPDDLDALVLYIPGDTLLYEVHDLYKRAHAGPPGSKFYEILYAGKNILLHMERKYLRKEDYIENLGMVRRPNIYKSLHAYYLIKGRRLVEVRRNEKSIEKAFPEYASEIRKLVKSEGLRVNREEDMARLIQLIEANEVNWAPQRKKS